MSNTTSMDLIKTADILRSSSNEIFNNWREICRKEILPARLVDDFSLLDSLPEFLEKMASALELNSDDAEKWLKADVAKKHGEERALNDNFFLDHVLLEFQILRKVALSSLEKRCTLSSRAREIMHFFLDCGIRKSAEKYVQMEATKEKELRMTLAEANRRLEESEMSLREIANTMPQVVWTARPDGHIDWYNDRWYTYTGALQGSSWYDKNGPMYPDDVGPTQKRWQLALSSGELYEMEFRLFRMKDKVYRWHIGRAVPIKDDEGKVKRWIGSTTDIHDHKELVERLKLEKNLREKFVAALTHDLRSPLTAAKMTSQLLQKKAHDSETVIKLSSKIMISLERAQKMIVDLLDANRIKAGEPLPMDMTPFDLVQLTHEVLADLSTIHGDRFKLRPPKSILGRWSKSGVQRIIENLCHNAVK